MTTQDQGKFTETDLRYLGRTVELAVEALEAGDAPFGSILVYHGPANDANDEEVKTFVREDRNRIATMGDETRHPEFELARWAASNLASAEQRRAATVYTSGEHCAMCAAAHAWAGLGEIVYVASSRQLEGWAREFKREANQGEEEGRGVLGPIATLPVQTVAPFTPVRGPVPDSGSGGLIERIRKLHWRYFERMSSST
ncbi:cytidine/deoxycytidylate deaminase [Xylariaceae sp. FL0594]|nr:cytidine/deoxycytidylate deaminase [Xylariaceae sp. FL0594]